MAMCNKRFIHSSSISLQRFALLHYLPLHYTSIHFTIYFAPHSKSIPSFHIAKPTLCFPCLGFCFATATMFFVLKQFTKNAITQKQKLQATPSTSALFATFHSVIHLLFPYATTVWYALFFLRHIAPIQRTKDISFFDY